MVYKMTEYIDIDTRRSLGLYSRLVVPQDLEELLTESFNKLTVGVKHSIVRLGEQRTTHYGFQDNVLKLIRSTVVDEDDEIYTHRIYVVQYIDQEKEANSYLMTWYDVPPEIEEDIWIMFPMDIPYYEY
jgi:hypothetical protein